MIVAVIAGIVALVATALIAARAAKAEAIRRASTAVDEARVQAAAEVKAAELEAATIQKQLETEARAEVLDAIAKADEALGADEARVQQREDALQEKRAEVASLEDAIDQREAQLAQIQREVQSRHDRARGIDQDVGRKRNAVRGELEKRAGIAAAELVQQMTNEWVQDAKARAAAQIRLAEQNTADPQHDRDARRIMEIAAARCSMHFLTERNLSTLRVGPEIVSVLLDNNAAIHGALEKVAGVQLQINDDKDVVRLDGLDGVGREVVRRALARMIKKPETIDAARKAPDEWAGKAREHLEQEIRSLGKKAFQALGIQKAHPEIVELVGALNFRTSYTQNQWLHAVEASFLAGMMAAELGLDEKLARRATLMHDIGKALTHKIEGSHAVIGADIARRLGESEVVANAIGSHHADEPPNSVYAYLVAASDAMSGARPGARREQAEGFSTKLEDLERIGMQRRGVSHAHAVHGGRELRVYVREREVDDLTVVEMSTEIANQIAEEMTFPGQIKVTVIRAFEATSTAN